MVKHNGELQLPAAQYETAQSVPFARREISSRPSSTLAKDASAGNTARLASSSIPTAKCSSSLQDTYPLTPLEVVFDIDTASLATEMALSVLDEPRESDAGCQIGSVVSKTTAVSRNRYRDALDDNEEFDPCLERSLDVKIDEGAVTNSSKLPARPQHNPTETRSRRIRHRRPSMRRQRQIAERAQPRRRSPSGRTRQQNGSPPSKGSPDRPPCCPAPSNRRPTLSYSRYVENTLRHKRMEHSCWKAKRGNESEHGKDWNPETTTAFSRHGKRAMPLPPSPKLWRSTLSRPTGCKIEKPVSSSDVRRNP